MAEGQRMTAAERAVETMLGAWCSTRWEWRPSGVPTATAS